LNPSSLSIDELAKILSTVGGRAVSAEQIRDDIESGAPSLPEGRISLIDYTAWLAREVQSI
jgi:hypothetical protein